ncbi:alpha/beta hydrolase [Streptomyces sp. NPDC005708]|uniref:alpha/beta fold hydrolase n=1 Tax=Streptomyces sp. NPDC005708 TaxID=3154564 RepID=UPI0033CE2684
MHVPDRSTVVTDDGAQLAVYTSGNDAAGTTAILAHGYMMSADVWRMQVRNLTARGFRVIRYDQRFHGNSIGGTDPTTVDRLAADLAHIITETSPSGPLVLAGHSLGGMAITALAASQPQLMTQRRPRVALISTSCSKVIFRPGNRPADWVKATRRAMYAYPTCWLPSASDRVRRHLPNNHFWALSPRSDRDPTTPPPCRQAIHHTHTAPIAELWASMRAFDTTGALEALSTLGDYVEIVTGELDDMIPLPKTRELARELPRARMHTPVPGARHRLPTDQRGHTTVTEMLARMCEATLSPNAPATAGIAGGSLTR